MKNRNSVEIDGRLTRDAEIRATKAGKEVCSFSIAVNGWNDETSFFDCVGFGKEKVSRHLKKGKLIGISGSLKQSRWSGQDGKSRSKVEIIADEIYLLEPRAKAADPEPVSDAGLYDADIPF